MSNFLVNLLILLLIKILNEIAQKF